MLTFKPSDLDTLLRAIIPAKQNLLITSSPGTGKTSLIKQAIKKVKADGFFMYPSIGDPTDAKGMPWIFQANGQPRAEFIPFGELREVWNAIDAGKLVALVLDDLGQGAPAVQASYMQLMDKLRGKCAVLAATNGRGHKGGVHGVLEPVKSRFHSIVELQPDLEDFCNHLLDDGIETYSMKEEAVLDIIPFLRFRPELLCAFNPTLDLTNSPCPRTWVAAGQQISLELPPYIEFGSIAGAIGEGAGGEFCAFKKMRRALPRLDQLLSDPQKASIPTDPSVRWAVCTGLAALVTEQNFPAIHIFAQRLYKESLGQFAVLLIRDVLRRCPTVRETKEFQLLANGPIGDLIAGTVKG